jgi:hypothetical protein
MAAIGRVHMNNPFRLVSSLEYRERVGVVYSQSTCATGDSGEEEGMLSRRQFFALSASVATAACATASSGVAQSDASMPRIQTVTLVISGMT